jgi:hypothetical protein
VAVLTVTMLDGIECNLDAAAHAQLLENILHVNLDRTFGQVQFSGDFLVAFAKGQ